MLFCHLLIFLADFLKKFFKSTIRVSNSLDPDILSGLIWVQTVISCQQKLPLLPLERKELNNPEIKGLDISAYKIKYNMLCQNILYVIKSV